MENRKRSSSAAATSCKKHPKHRQSPGVCSLCLRERLSKISTSSSHAVTNVSSSSSSSSISSLSSVSSSHCSSNASSYTASPMHSYRYRRQIHNLEGKGYLSFLKKSSTTTSTSVLRKSRSMAFVAERMQEDGDQKKNKGGFWSKFLGSKSSSNDKKRSMEEGALRMMHSRTMREMLTSRV